MFLAFSFSVSVLREANKSSTHRILVGNQREKTTFRSWFPFPFYISLFSGVDKGVALAPMYP